jgi:hypothetical protein
MPKLWRVSIFLNGVAFLYNGLLLLTGIVTNNRGVTFFACMVSGLCVLLLLKARNLMDV